MSPVLVFAHAGHWLVQLAYLVPLLGLLIAYGVGKARERRLKRADPRPADDEGREPTPRS